MSPPSPPENGMGMGKEPSRRARPRATSRTEPVCFAEERERRRRTASTRRTRASRARRTRSLFWAEAAGEEK